MGTSTAFSEGQQPSGMPNFYPLGVRPAGSPAIAGRPPVPSPKLAAEGTQRPAAITQRRGRFPRAAISNGSLPAHPRLSPSPGPAPAVGAASSPATLGQVRPDGGWGPRAERPRSSAASGGAVPEREGRACRCPGRPRRRRDGGARLFAGGTRPLWRRETDQRGCRCLNHPVSKRHIFPKMKSLILFFF